MTDLIESDYGPLPDTLQSGSPIWQAVVTALRNHRLGPEDGDDADDMADEIMRALTPLLWPLLPDNDDSQLSRLIGVGHALLALIAEHGVLPDADALHYALARLDSVLRECGSASAEGDVCQLPRGHREPYHQDGLGDAWNTQWGPNDPHPDWTAADERMVAVVFTGPDPF